MGKWRNINMIDIRTVHIYNNDYFGFVTLRPTAIKKNRANISTPFIASRSKSIFNDRCIFSKCKSVV